MNKTEITRAVGIETGRATYELWEVRGICGVHVISARTQDDFYCGSVRCTREDALALIHELAESDSDPFSIADIIKDINCKNVLYK